MSALTAAVALVELLTPVQVVLAYLYVLPLIVLSETARPLAIGRYTALASALTLANLVVPKLTPISGPMLTNRLLVCGALVFTARQCLRIQALQHQRLELQGQLAVEDLRRDFVATLAHDLKTPILGTIATLRSLASSRQRQEGALLERTLATIERGQSRALAQIQTLLEVYRNDAEGVLLQPEDVELTHLVEEVILELSALAEERQLTLRLGFGEASQWRPHRLRGDGTQLRRLVENLLLNAIHHSLRGGQIQVELGNRGGGLQLRVADGGPGVPEQEIPMLFQRFQRLSVERPGSGLGLYLCRQIVNAHGGTIGLRNRPGGGAEIEVLLPQARDEPPAGEPEPMRALVVEDDELFRLGLEITLQGFDVIETVTSVSDGEQALDLLRHRSFDLILLDLGLPGLGGLETCRRISAEHPQVPVLVVTSQEDPAWCLRMVRAGARGYVSKGVAAADLHLAIRTVLRGASWWDADATTALRELGAQGGPQTGERPATEADALALLTPRERQVLEAMARGLSNREIAAELGIGLGTVRVHGHAVMQKLEVANRTQAVLRLLHCSVQPEWNSPNGH